MSPFVAMFLGLVQGLTEFLPISSSAHVQIAESLLGLNGSKAELTAFIATIQLGTEAAVLVYFWKDIKSIVSGWFKSGFSKTPSTEARLGWLIIVGSMPVVVAGLLFKKYIETDFRNLWFIGFSLIFFGLVLGVVDRFGQKSKSLQSLSTKDGLLFGLGQMLAVIPGVSRSGGTISVGLALGYTREAAARYSFLLAIPAVLASGLYEFGTSYSSLSSGDMVATVIATIVSFVVGWYVIKFLLNYLTKGSFAPFVIWRVLLGSLVLVLVSSGVLGA